MEVVHERCAGLDIFKEDAKVCVRVDGSGRRKTVETVTTWGSTINQVLALREHLVSERVTCAVMEATGDYWKPFYHLLEDAGCEVMLVNPACEEPAGPQDRRRGCDLVGADGCPLVSWCAARSCRPSRSDSCGI